jgi:hypothetical protein
MGTRPMPGGWNRIQLPVSDLAGEVTRLRQLGVTFRREDIVDGYGGSQAWQRASLVCGPAESQAD